jgi:hypothetical protein
MNYDKIIHVITYIHLLSTPIIIEHVQDTIIINEISIKTFLVISNKLLTNFSRKLLKKLMKT